MKRSVVFDTDVSSMYIKGRLPEALGIKLAHANPVMTFVTQGELTKWTLVRDLGLQRRGEVLSWMDKTPFLEGNEIVANLYGRLSAAAKRRGRPRQANDMWIAACCMARRLPLATLNVRDYHDFAEHHGLELITA
jgi:predicted nucleic acid-binding protein